MFPRPSSLRRSIPVGRLGQCRPRSELLRHPRELHSREALGSQSRSYRRIRNRGYRQLGGVSWLREGRLREGRLREGRLREGRAQAIGRVPFSLNLSVANLAAQYSSQPGPDTARSPARAAYLPQALSQTASFHASRACRPNTA